MAADFRGSTGPLKALGVLDIGRYALRIGLVLGLIGAAQTPACAYDFQTSPYLLGDLGGERTRIAQRGIDFDFTFADETAHNLTGGDMHATRAATQLAAGMTADLDKLWGLRHTVFAFVMTDRFGRSWTRTPTSTPHSRPRKSTGAGKQSGSRN